MNFRFECPWAFLLLLPLVAVAWRLLRRAKRPAAVPFAAMRFLPMRTAGWRGLLAQAVPPVFLFGALLLVVAAARPQTFFAKERRSVDAIAIAMVVDVSGSMVALDLAKNPESRDAPTRLDVVKEEFAKFIERRPDDLLTLITFGGYATTRCPLTADHRAVLQYLKAVEIPGMEKDDEGRQISNEETLTAVGDGLTTACARLKESEVDTKIIVLLSDGVSNTGLVKPDRAAKVAEELGIKVYTIGVGSKTGYAPFRMRDVFGRSFVERGAVEFDEGELRKIAQITGGEYYGVQDRDGIERIMEKINELETTRVDRDVYNNYNERFWEVLALGAFLVSVSVAVSLVCLQRPL